MQSGTLITFEEEFGEEAMEKAVVSGIAFQRDEAKITLTNVPDKPGVAAERVPVVNGRERGRRLVQHAGNGQHPQGGGVQAPRQRPPQAAAELIQQQRHGQQRAEADHHAHAVIGPDLRQDRGDEQAKAPQGRQQHREDVQLTQGIQQRAALGPGAPP